VRSSFATEQQQEQPQRQQPYVTPPVQTVPQTASQPRAQFEPMAQTQGELQTDLDILRTELSERLRYSSAFDDTFLLAYWCLVVPVSGTFLLWSLLNGQLLPTLLASFLILIGRKFYRMAETLDVSRAAWQMNYLEHERVGLLVELLHDREPRIAQIAAMTLTAILPHLRPEEARFIDDEQRLMLYKRLSMEHSHKHTPLILAILKSIEKIGDADALPYVEQLAHSHARNRREEWIRESALVCLPLLRRRIHDAAKSAVPASQPETAATIGNSAPTAAVTQEEPLTEAQIRASARVKGLLATLEEERKTHQAPGMRQFFLSLAWLTVTPGSAFLGLKQWAAGDWVGAMMWGVLCAISTQLHRFTLSPKQMELAQKLIDAKDVQAVGPLAEMLEWPDVDCRRQAEIALTVLLPLVKASDTSLMTAKQKAALYPFLRPSETRRHWQLQLAILSAFEQIGDEAAIPLVTALADMRAASPVHQRVKERAETCLPFLSERAKQTRESQTLLRGSSMTTAAPETLLRPAHQSSETDPQQLLRPGS
jgi:hypothetical protein